MHAYKRDKEIEMTQIILSESRRESQYLILDLDIAILGFMPMALALLMISEFFTRSKRWKPSV